MRVSRSRSLVFSGGGGGGGWPASAPISRGGSANNLRSAAPAEDISSPGVGLGGRLARLLVVASLAHLLALAGVGAHPDANRLYEDLMMTYNRFVRPVQNDSDTVTVKLGLRLSQLIDVNLKNQMMTTNVWLDQEWNDYKLKWDPSEYGGIEDINLPAEQIWLPDIALYNSAEGYFAVSIMTKAKVKFDGHVTWNPPAIFRSSCQIDITYFPFDSQNCHLKFGSWTYGTKIDLRHINDTDQLIERGTDLSEYYQNVEWDIMQASAKRNVITYICCPNDFYPDVTFHFNIRRKPLFYTVNLIIPCIGITILSLLVFYLPSDSGEKVTLTISILVSLIFFLSVLIETIPSTSLAMPLLGKYLVFTMILITLSVCATVCVLNIHFRTPSTHSMSPWIKRWCIDILPKYLFMNVPHYQSQQASVLPEQLVYLHNQAYASPVGLAASPLAPPADPEDLLQNYLSPLGYLRLQQHLHQSAGEGAAGGGARSRVGPADRQHPSVSVELDARQLQRSADSSALTVGAASSSLFLPYLQSEAARRLQLQRSRSSDRDNRSASDNQPTNGNNSTTINVPTRSCDTNSTQRTDAAAAISVPSASGANPSAARPKRTTFLSSLFGGRRRSRAESQGDSAGSQRRESRSRTRKSSNQSNSRVSNADSSGNDDDNEYTDYDYQHHRHFQARASVCSTNLWRIGPTRRCSMAVPANYPTYYRPLVQLHNQAAPGELHTLSGCVSAGPHQHHFHTGDYGHSEEQRPRGAAVGALAQAAASSSLVRPKQQVAAGVRMANPAHKESGQTRSSSSQQHPVTKLLNGGARPRQFVAPLLNVIGQQQQLPRSRSTDHRLSSIYASTTTASTDLQVPTPPAPLRLTSGIAQLDPQALASIQRQQWDSRHQPVGRTPPHALPPSVGNPAHLLAGPQQSLSIGRALGQAYMQRLQRQPTVSLHAAAAPTQQRQSRSVQRGEAQAPNQSLYLPAPGPVDCRTQQQFSEQMRRSRSHSSLNQNSAARSRLVLGLTDDCEKCNSLRRSIERNSRQQVDGGLPTLLVGAPKNLSGCSCTTQVPQPQATSGFRRQPPDLVYCSSAGERPCSCGSQTRPSGARDRQPPVDGLQLMKLISEVDKAIQNAMFIAQHIDNLDEFESVKENWKYIAMVIDRIFLIIFLVACIAGTVAIFAMVPWSYYTSARPIDLQMARLIGLNLTGVAHDEIGSSSCQDF